MLARITGVDPGLVDTGVVTMVFRPERRMFKVYAAAVRNSSKDQHNHAEAVAKTVEFQNRSMDRRLGPSPVFVEEYRPRQKLQSDKQMLELQAHLRTELPDATFLGNQGIKQLITSDLMKLFDVWTFPGQPTHHQDLRSAARIALLGAVRDSTAQDIINQFVYSSLCEETPWEKY